MRVLSTAIVLSTLLVSAGCDQASDLELLARPVASNPSANEQSAALVELTSVEEAASAPAPRRAPAARPRATTVRSAPAPVYTPQPQVVTKTNIKRDAAIGAGVGAAVGAIAHDRNRLKGALVGGVIGGAAGAVVGATIDKSQRVRRARSGPGVRDGRPDRARTPGPRRHAL